MRLIAIVLLSMCCLPRLASAALTIQIDYMGDSAYESSFVKAKTTWETLLGGHQDGMVLFTSAGSSYVSGQMVSNVFINAEVRPDDGIGGRLGKAGVDEVAQDTSGFILSTNASMEFDSADIGLLTVVERDSLVLHELAHALGFGNLWTQNSLYVPGSGEFLGAEATAVWQSEFGQLGIPDIETEGGPGTAGGHWNENLNGSGLTGITDSLGRDMRDELMTGWLNPNSFISELTLASFRDIGFTTTNATAVPEPGTGGVLVAGLVVGMGWRRRRSL